MSPSSEEQPVLEVHSLSAALGGKEILHDISFRLGRGCALSLVGESGSGKSTLLLALMGLLPDGGAVTAGHIFLNGKELTGCPRRQEGVRGRELALLFQELGSAFNPVRKIGKQYRDCLEAAGWGEAWKKRAQEALLSAGLPDTEKILRSYAFQLSGGQRQRAAAAMVLSLNPQVILADEPTSALDTLSSLHLLRKLKEQTDRGQSLLFVTHHIRAAACLGGQILVMKAGRIVEQGDGERILNAPSCAYTKELLESVLRLEP